jgi:PAS domain S-box-containing protein
MTVSSVPIWGVDVIGSIGMIVLAFMCVRLAGRLRRRDPNNIIWTYLFWVCTALAVFAVSRSAGHILKQLLIISGDAAEWNRIRPYSGAINTLTFAVVGAITLFFQRSWSIYRQIAGDKQDLQAARDKLLYLNQNLENLVEARTAALTFSEHKYRRIFEISRDMILVAEKDGTIVDVNPAGQEMLDLPDSGKENRQPHFQQCFASVSDWHNLLARLEQDGFVSNAEIEMLHKHHRIRTLLSGSLDRGLGDRPDTIHFLVKDIEQKRLTEEQIAQADKLASIGQLSAGIAHEINNPLGIILGYTQLLLRHENGASEKYNDLKIIEKHVRNCKTIVEDLLNFARTSTPKKTSIHITDVLDEVLRFIRQHADLGHIDIQRAYDPAVPPMLLDEKKIKQVFMNLIMNAKHAIGESGRLSLSTLYRPAENRVIVKIADSGCGIEERNMSRIFDPFFTTKPTGEGTGLGLSVSYGIIKNHGGDISVESHIGRGSTFTITLPVDVAREDAEHATQHTDRR